MPLLPNIDTRDKNSSYMRRFLIVEPIRIRRYESRSRPHSLRGVRARTVAALGVPYIRASSPKLPPSPIVVTCSPFTKTCNMIHYRAPTHDCDANCVQAKRWFWWLYFRWLLAVMDVFFMNSGMDRKKIVSLLLLRDFEEKEDFRVHPFIAIMNSEGNYFTGKYYALN